eukprot:gene53225-71159_t
MGYRVIDLKQFLSKIEREENTPLPIRFTWLIGAGFSVSAGLPLAKEVSHILAVYEYLGRHSRDSSELILPNLDGLPGF